MPETPPPLAPKKDEGFPPAPVRADLRMDPEHPDGNVLLDGFRRVRELGVGRGIGGGEKEKKG